MVMSIKVNHHKMRILKVRCIEIFPIEELKFLKIKFHDFYYL
jgi:hypothetical protein